MNFFGRAKEIEILRRERELSLENSRFTVVSGRRRIGKNEQDISLFREASAKSQAGLQVFAAVVGGHVGVEAVSIINTGYHAADSGKNTPVTSRG